jgi:hypothetical protein
VSGADVSASVAAGAAGVSVTATKAVGASPPGAGRVHAPVKSRKKIASNNAIRFMTTLLKSDAQQLTRKNCLSLLCWKTN